MWVIIGAIAHLLMFLLFLLLATQRADCATLLTVICYICTIHCRAPLHKVMTNLRLCFSAHVLKYQWVTHLKGIQPLCRQGCGRPYVTGKKRENKAQGTIFKCQVKRKVNRGWNGKQ